MSTLLPIENFHLHLWAKLWPDEHIVDNYRQYPLILHMLDVGITTGILWDKWLRAGLRYRFETELGIQARSIVCAVCALHDLGKANPVFQTQVYSQHLPKGWSSQQQELLRTQGYEIPAFQKKGALSHVSIGNSQDTYRNDIIRRHEQVSAFALAGDNWITNRTTIDLIHAATCVSAHHGTFPPGSVIGSTKNDLRSLTQLTPGWEPVWRDLKTVVAHSFGISQLLKNSTDDLTQHLSPVSMLLLSGLMVLADRLASTDVSVKPGVSLVQAFKDGSLSLQEWMDKRTAALDALARSSVGFYQPFENPESDILPGYRPNELQQQAQQADHGLWIACAPTGGGKTEAALLRHASHRAAQEDRHLEHLMFLLPTQATSNALVKRLQRYYSRTHNVASLAHGLASVEDFYNSVLTAHVAATEEISSGLYPTDFVRHGAARLLAPVCAGTIDQALLGALPSKWNHLRLLALANAHVVIDEAHTLEPYQATILKPLLSWWGATQTRVTMLSATLPSYQLQDFMEAYQRASDSPLKLDTTTENISRFSYPCTIDIPALGSVDVKPLTVPTMRLHFDLDPLSSSDQQISDHHGMLACNDAFVAAHAQWFVRARTQYPEVTVGFIVNTVDRAQYLAQTLLAQGYVDSDKLIVLHSRMTAQHRSHIGSLLEHLIGPHGTAQGICVIGTQAIEASLDIDLDLLSTDLAPAANLIQRAGRMWRHKAKHHAGMSERPAIHIVYAPASDPLYKIAALPYDRAELYRVQNYLMELPQPGTLIMPDQAQSFINTASIDFDTFIHESSDYISDQIKELAGISERVQQALDRRINIKPILNTSCALNDLHGITTSLRASDEQLTRFIDRENYRILLYSSKQFDLPIYHGSLHDIEALSPYDRDELRKVLASTLTISGTWARELVEHSDGHRKPSLDTQIAALIGIYPIDISQLDNKTYDPLLGLLQQPSADTAKEVCLR